MNKLFYYLLLFLVSCGLHHNIHAQVTIGDGTPPQNFSILELSSKTTKGGMRLPHLTTAERNALNNSNTQFQAEMGRVVNDLVLGSRPGLALGLTIYNTDTQCIEYWDSYKWVSLCLGTAEIKLKETCGATPPGYYDPANPPVSSADGTPSNCFYTPEEIPPCIVTSGEEYQIYITAGDGYADLLREDFTTSFSVRFQPNNTNKSRNAVVRIVNNCTGEFKDFIFTQAGATCPTTSPFSLNATALDLCSGGSVYAYVQSPDPAVEYVWTYSGAIVHTGTWYEIKRSGVYTVYPGLVGCPNHASVTVNAKSDVAPSSVTISATNGGILCAGGNVILTAANATTVQWYHNGIPYTPGGTANPLTVTGSTMAGQWFAVATDANGCNSTSSNIINLQDNTTGSTALDPPVMLIDGAPTPFASINICKGSVVVLDIDNAGAYLGGTMFEWFVNGTSIGASANTLKDYTVPAGATNLVFAVQVSNSGVNCPNTTVSSNIPVTSIAPDRTSINNGQVNGYVCGANPAILTAAYQAGTEYEWRRDGIKIVGANTFQYTTTTLGVYTVRYKSVGGCWSRFSPAITVINSSPITMMWELAPDPTAIYGDNKTYSVKTAPVADNYTWTASGSVSGAIPMYPSGNGSLATITYPTLTSPAHENITINVTATNGCGTTVLPPRVVDLGPGCIPVSSVNINPPGKSTINIPGNLVFTATSQVGANYTWYLDGTEVQSRSTLHTYNYIVASNASPGPHTLSVTADGCTGLATTSVPVIVVPNPTDPSIPHYTGNKAYFTGQVCFDVNKKPNPGCGDVSGRIDAFADTKTFNYTLIPDGGATLSDIAFVVLDNSKLLDAGTPYSINDKILTINFRPDIRDYIADNGDATVTLYAIFKVNGGGFQKLMLTLNVKDCSCCGAFLRLGNGQPLIWKTFQCHNLGADTSKKPNMPSKEIAGDYYQWAYKDPAATSFDGSGAITGWKTSLRTLIWNTTDNNPCPSGFRVPNKNEWEGVLGERRMNPIQQPSGSWNGGANNFDIIIHLGANLSLPINGYRGSNNGTLSSRGSTGYYWTSHGQSEFWGAPYYNSYFTKASAVLISSGSIGVADTESPATGGSVRCIAVD